MKGHWSDCAIYNAPACEPGPCDCGGLELADDVPHTLVAPFVALPGSEGLVGEQEGGKSFVQPQQFPADRLASDTSAPDLPHTHRKIASSAEANGVDLYIAREPVVGKP